MTEIGTIIDGKYEILKEIGRGGMSTVYLAMDSHLNKQWAVKEIRKKGTGANDEIVVNSLLAEANLMKRLDHPALPRIVDIIDNGITIYVVMDYIEGESLDKILKEYGVQDEEKVIEWAKQICDALSYLHSQKPRPIVYRDMKPANIMLKPEGNIKIIDFGIAREYKEQNLADTKVLGTRGFAPPEAYNGQTTPRSDIYSLGMTMHNLLTGVDPRMGDGYVPVRQINPNLSEGIELIIDKCVQPAEENRYQSCADLIYDLEHPDLITSGYKKKQKRKIIATAIPLALSIIMAFSGLGTALGAKAINENNYEAYVARTGDLELYQKAVILYPDREDAYLRLVEYYEDKVSEGKGFTSVDFAKFEGIYHGGNKDEDGNIMKNHSAELQKANPAVYADINFRMAILCYFDYVSINEEGQLNDGVIERCNKAIVYLDRNKEIEGYTPSYYENSLYEICEFQKHYIPEDTKYDLTTDECEKLFVGINKALDSIENDTTIGNYERVSYYYAVFCLLNSCKEKFSGVDVEKGTLIDLLDRVYEMANDVKDGGSNKYTKEMKQKIISEHQNYKVKIENEYKFKEEK